MARFTESVDIRPAATMSVDSSSLSNRLDAFSQQQLAIHTQQTAQRSFAEGQAAFDGDQPEFKEEKFFGKVSSSNYNKGLRAAYVASLDRDNREEIAKITAENPDSLAKFNDQVESYRTALLNNVDPATRRIIADSLDSLVSANRIKVQTNEIERNHKNNAEEVSSQVDAAVTDALGFARDGNDQSSAESALVAFSSVDAAADAGFISSEQAEAKKRDIEKGLAEEKIKGELFRTFDDSGEQAAFDQLDSAFDKRPKGFAPEEWDDFIASAQTDLNRKSNRRRQIEKENLKEVSLQESIDRGFLFTNPNVPADPAKSNQDRKDVNNYYNSVSAGWKGDQNALIEQNVNFIKSTGIVPDTLGSGMNAVMRSGGAEDVVTHMELMQRLQTDAPNSIRDFSSESRAVSLQVSDAINNGMEAETAIEAARKNTFGLTPTQKEEIRLASSSRENKEDRLSRFEDMVSDEFDPLTLPVVGLFRGAPDIPAGMQAAYMSNFDNFMALTNGNIEQSENLAFESTKNVWGVTKVGKRRFMQYPPESFYHVDGFNDSWIEDQMLEELESIGVEGAQIGIDDMVSRSGSPSYPVLAPNDEGFMDVLEDESGNPLRFKPDFRQTQEYKDLIAAPGIEVEKAKARREKNLVRRANVIRRKVNNFVFTDNLMPRSERPEFLSSDEGKVFVRRAVNNLIAGEDIDQVEAKEVLKAYGAGGLEDLPGFEVLMRVGKIHASN